MKKFFASVGLITVGTVGLQAAYAPGLNSMSASKIWSASGTLRGFYDDNYNTSSPGPNRRGSYGFEISPEVDLNVALQQTELGLRYTYGMYYYQDRQDLSENPIDQTHQFDLWVDHAFTERWQGKVMDSFVIGQEPELIGGGQEKRVNGNNIRNTGTLDLDTSWTRLFSTKLSYQNTFYDYQNSGTTTAEIFPGGQPASLAGTLNRIEQLISLDLQWAVERQTIVFVGGAFGWVGYTGDEPIAFDGGTGNYIFSNARDNRSYFGYAGVQHNLLANLSFTGKAGLQYTDNYNNPSGSSTSVNPYADLSLIYTYLPGSYAQIGFTQTENATENLGQQTGTGNIALFTESSTVYGSINQKLTPKMMGTFIARWQHSVYNGGIYNNQADDYYSLGANLSYAFNQHFSAEAGYNWDYLQSQIPGNLYSRNRIYLGVSAVY